MRGSRQVLRGKALRGGRTHHSKSQWGFWGSERAGVKVTAFRTRAWVSRVPSMLLGSQVVLEEQGGFGSREEGSSPLLGEAGEKEWIPRGQLPGVPWVCPPPLEGRFCHVTSGAASHSFSHPKRLAGLGSPLTVGTLMMAPGA